MTMAFCGVGACEDELASVLTAAGVAVAKGVAVGWERGESADIGVANGDTGSESMACASRVAAIAPVCKLLSPTLAPASFNPVVSAPTGVAKGLSKGDIGEDVAVGCATGAAD
jgi:hypothetical protein